MGPWEGRLALALATLATFFFTSRFGQRRKVKLHVYLAPKEISDKVDVPDKTALLSIHVEPENYALKALDMDPHPEAPASTTRRHLSTVV